MKFWTWLKIKLTKTKEPEYDIDTPDEFTPFEAEFILYLCWRNVFRVSSNFMTYAVGDAEHRDYWDFKKEQDGHKPGYE